MLDIYRRHARGCPTKAQRLGQVHRNGFRKKKASVRLCIHCHNWAGQRKRRGRQTLVYAFWGVQPKTTDWVYQIFRLRFGIETSYRQLNEARIKTTTPNPQLRLLFIGIASLLRDLWYTGIIWPVRDGVDVN